MGEINEKQTHVSILISITLLSILIHYVAMPFLYEYSFPFQILIGMTTLFIDIIACSYILYFSNMKEGLPRLFWTILSVGTSLTSLVISSLPINV